MTFPQIRVHTQKQIVIGELRDMVKMTTYFWNEKVDERLVPVNPGYRLIEARQLVKDVAFEVLQRNESYARYPSVDDLWARAHLEWLKGDKMTFQVIFAEPT